MHFKSLKKARVKIIKAALSLVALILAASLFSCGGIKNTNPWGALTGSVAVMAPEQSAASHPAALNPDSELRGVWIATVSNINYPSKQGLSEAELKAELDDIIATAKAAGLNAIYFQARPACDAMYKSDIFPTSAYLSGKQGQAADGDFDPLAYLVAAGHLNRIAVHAWVNPLRVTAGSQAYPNTDLSRLAQTNPARQHPEWVVEYGGALYFNVGIPEVRELIAQGVREIVSNYDVDGVIFDDYFYPYPVATKTASGASYIVEYEDGAAYDAYGGDYQDKGDWRRSNVNVMVESCYWAVKEKEQGCLFGIAPFGIWRNDNGTNGGSATSGLQSYSELYADSLAWIKGGYLDYIAPQIYWSFSTSVARYDTLVKWWNAQLDGTDVKLVVCHGAYRYKDFEKDPAREIQNQVEYARSELHYNGSIMYGYEQIKENTWGLADELVSLYAENIIYTDTVSNGAALTFTSPASGATLSYGSTYVLGYCDPAEKLVLDGYPVSRTKNGYFSLFLPLAPGENKFEFLYGEEKVVYTLKRQDNASGGYTQLSSFAVTSVSPAAGYIGQEGTVLGVSCTAPAGSTVTAALNGVTVALSSTIKPEGTAKYYAEVYKGTITLPKATKGKSELVGKITFTAKKGGESASAESGDIKVLGDNTGILVAVKNDNAALYNEPAGDFYTSAYTPQSKGACDWALAYRDGYYLLQMGAWVAAADVEVKQTGEISAFSGINSLLLWQTGGETKIYMKSEDSVPITAALQGDKLVFTLHSTFLKNSAVTYDGSSPVVKTLNLSEDKENGRVYAQISLINAENYYGYTVSYVKEQGVNCILIIIKNPKNTDLSKEEPLKGITIVLDAGHGGNDNGALGFLSGKNGEREQNEADLNLEITLLAKEKLESLGANVVLTRSEDIYVSLQDRLAIYYSVMPDLALSIHQNSMLYNADITKISGTIGLWWSECGRALAEKISSSVSKALKRYQFETRAQELYMCRSNAFPSALVEVGFMTNAEEYEMMVNGNGKERAAQAITDGILEFFAMQNKY